MQLLSPLIDPKLTSSNNKMIPARGPQTRVGVIIDDADDGAGDGDGDDDDDGDDGDEDDDEDDNDSKADDYDDGDGDEESFQAQQQRTRRYPRGWVPQVGTPGTQTATGHPDRQG